MKRKISPAASFQLRAEFRPVAPDGEGGTRVIQVQEKYLSVPGKCGTGKFGSLESWEDVLCKTGDTAVRCKNANVIVRRSSLSDIIAVFGDEKKIAFRHQAEVVGHVEHLAAGRLE